MKKIFLLCLMLSPVWLMAQEKTLKSGIKYTIYTRTEGRFIGQGNVVTMNLEERTGTDSLIFSSRQTGRPIQMQYTGHDAKGDLREVFPLLKKGDSVLVKVPVDSMQIPPLAQRPSFLKSGSFLQYRISIKNIQTVEEAIAERQSESKRRNADEVAALDRFLTQRKIDVKKDSSGLRYYVRDTTGKQKPMPGDTVWVNYIGRTLQEKIFDSSIENVALRANLKQPGRIY
ncbi:MAG: peptidylprolyl isomerase, partial [Mucilaginibacter polytrichastri]|nr:peptidylprolyl isomerase [Mucilaginibacter polytrichastri]